MNIRAVFKLLRESGECRLPIPVSPDCAREFRERVKRMCDTHKIGLTQENRPAGQTCNIFRLSANRQSLIYFVDELLAQEF